MAAALRALALRAAPAAHATRLRLVVEPAVVLTHLQIALPTSSQLTNSCHFKLVEGGGFEPPKA